MKPKIRITEEEKETVQKAQRANRDKRVDKWLTVLLLRADNVTLEKIAERTGYSRSQVSNILKLYAESGLEGITSNHYHGNRRYLTIEEESAILEQFRQRAEAGQIIEVKEIRKVYETAVGHEVSYSQIYCVLKRHNWRKVMPRRRHPNKATPEAIEASKKLRVL